MRAAVAALLLLTAGLCSEAQEIAAEFEECHHNECINEDISLIQKKLEVGIETDKGEPESADSSTEGGASSSDSSSVNSKKERFVWPWESYHFNHHRMSDNVVASWDMYIVDSIVSWFIWMVLALLIWNCCYPVEHQLFRDPEDPVWTFKHNHFACLKRPKICCCSCVCPGLQWADTMHLAGFLKIQIGLSIFFACALLNGLTLGGMVMYGVFTNCLIILYRQRLREKLSLKSWTSATCLFDCLFVCCCTCCAISQEAQVVRYAYQQGRATDVGTGRATSEGASPVFVQNAEGAVERITDAAPVFVEDGAGTIPSSRTGVSSAVAGTGRVITTGAMPVATGPVVYQSGTIPVGTIPIGTVPVVMSPQVPRSSYIVQTGSPPGRALYR